ncbi:MAG: sulfotransferase [Chloroflexi bacterium]|nr:sulfotransferase [Chloroflexota bacterium]
MFLKKISRRVRRTLQKERNDTSFPWDWSTTVSEANAVIIGGSGRSGTTLLRVMLDSHPNICIGPESWLFTPKAISIEKLAHNFELPKSLVQKMIHTAASRPEFIDVFFAKYSHRVGKSRWGEKTPANILYISEIFRAFPNARFIHVIRDGRDVACSIRTHPRVKEQNGQFVPTNIRRPLGPCIQQWIDAIEAGNYFTNDARYLEIKYEDLIRSPEYILERILFFLNEPWNEQLLEYYTIRTASRDVKKFPQNIEATKPLNNDSLGRWQQEFTQEDRALFKKMAGNLLAQLGYATDMQW